MSIRLLALYLTIAGLSIYSFKDWFKSLCGMILVMALIHHEDMPTNMFGIQGFNVWNILFAVIFLAWLVSRQCDGLKWDMPRHIKVLLLLYLGVILVGFLRAVLDRSYLEDYLLKDMISEELINTVKWVIPGILLFDGCRTRKRVIMASTCLLAMYLLLSVQIIKRMPLESALGGGGERIQHTRLKVCRSIGYSAPDMSTILAGASWGMLAALPLMRKKKYWIIVLTAAGLITFGQALTGGRAGYAAWGATGLVLCLLKWRKFLLLAPVALLLLPIMLPATAERMLFGFGQRDAAGQTMTDDYEVTSGRTLIWPHVIDKIGESPMVGYGRLGMRRSGLTEYLRQTYGEFEAFPHPHNMYLETLLDNGIIGTIPIFIFWGVMVVYAARLFRSGNPLYSAAGGLALALMLAQLFAGIGSQHFYPRESTFCVWVAMFLSLRVYVEQSRAKQEAKVAVHSQQPWVFNRQPAIIPAVNAHERTS
jgi:O-antigen ligase